MSVYGSTSHARWAKHLQTLDLINYHAYVHDARTFTCASFGTTVSPALLARCAVVTRCNTEADAGTVHLLQQALAQALHKSWQARAQALLRDRHMRVGPQQQC